MGCTSLRMRNIQQGKRQQKMQQGSDQIPIFTLIFQLHSIITSSQVQAQSKPDLIVQKSSPAQKNMPKICEQLHKLLQNSQPDPDYQSQILIVSSYLVTNTKYHEHLNNIKIQEINSLGRYMMKQNNSHVLDAIVRFVQAMFLEHGYAIYAESQVLFQAINGKFGQYGSDQVRELATQILVEMLLEKKSLLKFANQPYYFMEYWLFTINQENQLDRQLFWIQCVKRAYQLDKNAQNYLFFDNDFRAFIDLLVRIIEGCPDGKTLRIPLQCYLSLSVTNKMKSKLYRLQDIKGYLQAINVQSLGIQDLSQEIEAIK